MSQTMKIALALVYFYGPFNGAALAQTETVNQEHLEYELQVESGFLGVQNHRIMFSENNTYFDYVEDGGQDTLFSFQRYTVNLIRPRSYQLRFVYQPIDLQTTSTLQDDLTVDNVTFNKGTPMEFRYGFPYYRGTWLKNLASGPTWNLAAGIGLQIRNATITFSAADGSRAVQNRDVGPVPLFAVLADAKLATDTDIIFEAEGNYANTSYINGDDDSGVKGAIIDTAVTLRSEVSRKAAVLSTFRYLSGGAEGKSTDKDTPTGDGYTSNWIDLMAFTVGLVLDINNL